MTEGDTSIQSPADIYKLYCPKPILKKVICEETNKNISQNVDNVLNMVDSLEEDRTDYHLFTEKDSNLSEHKSSATDSISYEQTQSGASMVRIYLYKHVPSTYFTSFYLGSCLWSNL